MKKAWFALATALIILLSSCAVKTNEVIEYQQEQNETDVVAKQIADYLLAMDEIEKCNVRISGSTAVVAINTAKDYGRDDAFLIELKHKIIADIKSQNAYIQHVTVTAAPDIFERIYEGETESAEEDEIERELEKNTGEEIFNNVMPTV